MSDNSRYGRLPPNFRVFTGLTEEVVKSSAIEGEHLNPKEVRSSIAGKIGLDVGGLPNRMQA